MTKFHEGQDVEVLKLIDGDNLCRLWRKAKIVTSMRHKDDPENDRYEVKFPDGTRASFDAEHIREAEHIGIASGPASGEQRVRVDYND